MHFCTQGISPAVGCFIQPHPFQAHMIAITVTVQRIKNGKRGTGEILCRWHTIKHHRFMSGQRAQKLRHGMILAPNQERVVPHINDMPFGQCLDFGEIHHHPIIRTAGNLNDTAGKRDLDGIAVPMQVAALALMIRNPVAGIEFKAAGNLHG